MSHVFLQVKKYCISLLKQFGSFDYTRDTLKRLDQEARQQIESLGMSQQAEEYCSQGFMDALSIFGCIVK